MLVIEYGYLDHQEPNSVPGLLNVTPYLFNITSTPQRGLDNATFAVPAAAVVGGGTVVNGMFFDRGSAPDYDAWVELGNPGWGWEDLLPYFKKVEAQTSSYLYPLQVNVPARARILLPQQRTSRMSSRFLGITSPTGLVARCSPAILCFSFSQLVGLSLSDTRGLPRRSF